MTNSYVPVVFEIDIKKMKEKMKYFVKHHVPM